MYFHTYFHSYQVASPKYVYTMFSVSCAFPFFHSISGYVYIYICWLCSALAWNSMMVDKTTNIAPAAAPCSAMSSMTEMAVSPASVASSGHFPFTPSDITGIGIDSSVLDSAFTTDMGTSGEMQLGMDGGPGTSKDTLRSGGQLPWTLSLTDLTADLTNLEGDLILF